MLGEDRLQRCWGALGGASEVGVGDGRRKETDCNPWPCAVGRLLLVRVDLGSSWEVPACLGLGIPSGVEVHLHPSLSFLCCKMGTVRNSASHGC